MALEAGLACSIEKRNGIVLVYVHGASKFRVRIIIPEFYNFVSVEKKSGVKLSLTEFPGSNFFLMISSCFTHREE